MRHSHLLSRLFLLVLIPILAACGQSGAGQPAATTPAEQAGAPAAQTGMSFSEGSTRYVLDPAQSSAGFSIGEILLGEPNTVTAVSSGVTGEIAVDFDNLANTAVGPIRVDATQFQTDNNFRNRAIESRILLSSAYPMITFVPTAISGLPQSVTWGTAVPLQITGDLTITDKTKPVTFDVMVTPVSETQLEGQATATILLTDFDIVVPSAPSVAGVDDSVALNLAFVATAQ